MAEAGVPGAITIATNMAGRGTDIQLGGNVDMRIAQECAGLEPGPERDAKEAEIRAEIARLQEQGHRGGRPLHRGHRAAREPAHRQPAARPLRPPGRSRPVEVLPVAAGRPDAHLRIRAHGHGAEAPGPAGGRGDRPSLDQQGAGKGAAEGRSAQLRHAQEHPEIRRRDERPAQGRVRAASRHDGPGLARGADRRDAVGRGGRPDHPARAARRLCRSLGHRGSQAGLAGRPQSRRPGRGLGQGRGHRRRGDARAAAEGRRGGLRGAHRSRTAPT